MPNVIENLNIKLDICDARGLSVLLKILKQRIQNNTRENITTNIIFKSSLLAPS